MKAVKALFKNGSITMLEEPPAEGPVEVLVVFPDGESDSWDRILNDTRRRPALDEMIRQVEQEIAEGKAKPLDLNQL